MPKNKSKKPQKPGEELSLAEVSEYVTQVYQQLGIDPDMAITHLAWMLTHLARHRGGDPYLALDGIAAVEAEMDGEAAAGEMVH